MVQDGFVFCGNGILDALEVNTYGAIKECSARDDKDVVENMKGDNTLQAIYGVSGRTQGMWYDGIFKI